MKASNIIWDINENDIFEAIDELPSSDAAILLQISHNSYKKLNREERCYYFRDAIHHNRIDAAELVGLPDEVDIPPEIGTNDEDIANWISDEFGYCIEGFAIS